jgi:hypothetical protein
MHYQLDTVDVHTTRRDVGSYQHPGQTRAESREVAVTSRLRKIAVQVN